ncbi:MAG: metal-sensing transcriptional repressor [Ewingella americana]|jgi:DNA-binding FrmR family transcriptional regulator|uniref:metal-sensing transcriptional repressor n=1 Tax=Ewingella americana TaxID=41202 RepID=UPI00163A1890|nr:metal-sensing transcriptional repressor [Ewingella americana]MCI1678295.1 metal-sensing transcriptional repressor [Ewingella americana]MCI1856068.1 metal-sensing transcriptional repressor [Ewingella americana]MCI1862293.1 metal-sensing transcriptional repressor [Ewingella americana]MCI2142754.1 metal-sensing transcriptional repressor [Ewingella americana]MCI2162545.1 metal-sensing transcriptional repressor [Ewingella americana]
MHLHETHPEIIKRLKRATGHLNSVITMLESGRTCLDIAQQLQAVEKAVSNAKKTLIHDHLDHCLDHAVKADGEVSPDVIREFKEITKYL